MSCLIYKVIIYIIVLTEHDLISLTISISNLRLGRFDLFAHVAQPRVLLATSGLAQRARLATVVHRVAARDRVRVVAHVVLVHPVVALLVLRVLDHGATDRHRLVHHDLGKVANILAVGKNFSEPVSIQRERDLVDSYGGSWPSRG